MLLLVSWGRRRQNFPGTIMTRRTDHTRGFHGIYQVCGTVVADLEFTLYGGDRHPSVLGHKSDRFVEQSVSFVTTACTAFAEGWHARQVLTFGAVKHIIHVFRFTPGFPGTDHPVYFVIVNEGSVYPNRQAGTRRQV